jgi:N-acetylmuramoyl-L-alanine amidase
MTTTKRAIKHIVIHCTATPQNTSIQSIKDYWRRMKGWGDVAGYHYIIRANGEIIKLLEDSKISNGVFGHNASSINVAYIGGVDKNGAPLDNRTLYQKESMFNLIVSLCERYPQAVVLGHRDFKGVMKDCPSFDVKKWLLSFVPNVIVTSPYVKQRVHIADTTQSETQSETQSKSIGASTSVNISASPRMTETQGTATSTASLND